MITADPFTEQTPARKTVKTAGKMRKSAFGTLPLKTRLLFFILCSSVVPEENDFFRSRSFPFLEYAQLQWRMGEYSASSVRSAVSLLRNQGLITTISKEGKTQIRATSIGREFLLSQFPGGKSRNTRWDDTWRVVLFSGVRESTRTFASHQYRIVRALLQKYAFAPLERGVYLSPHPLPDELRQNLLESKKLQFLTVLETKRFVIGDERAFAYRAWNISLISKQYAKLSSEGERLLAFLEKEKTLNSRTKARFLTFSLQVFYMLQLDPALPSILLPEQYGAEQNFTLFLNIASRVAELAREDDRDSIR